MNLKEQQYVVALADYGNMTQAARALGVTQPALSSYLSGVEHNLGAALFERRGRQLVPTYLGEAYLDKARKILALGEEFEKQLEQVASGYQGRIRVGIPIRRSPQLLPSALKIFRNQFPNVEIVLHEGNLENMAALLAEDKLDILLCNLIKSNKNLEYIQLCRDPVVFLVPSEHPYCRFASYRREFRYPWIDLKQFSKETFILQHHNQSLRYYSDQLLQEADIQPQRTLFIRNIETSAQMSAYGLGVSFCLESYIKHMKFVQRPQVFSVGTQQLAADFSAAYRRGVQLPDYTLQFIQLLKDLMETELRW